MYSLATALTVVLGLMVTSVQLAGGGVRGTGLATEVCTPDVITSLAAGWLVTKVFIASRPVVAGRWFSAAFDQDGHRA